MYKFKKYPETDLTIGGQETKGFIGVLPKVI